MKPPAGLKVLYPAEAIAERIRGLGREISEAYALGSDLVVVGVLRGSFLFMADLVRAIDVPLACDFLGIESYGDATETSGVVQITSDLKGPIEGKDLLVVEDIVDTGLTMAYLLDFLKTRGPRSVRVCALLHKPSRTIKPVPIDFLGFTVPNHFVVGYGLDHEQRYRNLPYIGYFESGPERVPE